MQTMISLSDSLRKIHLALYPHELDNQHKKLDFILNQIKEKVLSLEQLMSNSKTLFLKRFDELSEKICMKEIKQFEIALDSVEKYLSNPKV